MLLVLCVALTVGFTAADKGCANPQASNTAVNQTNNNSNGCPINQHYESCASLCAVTCNNYQNPPTNCQPGCYYGCVCDKEYVRNPQGDCVPPQQCNTGCPPNQHYENCATLCPLTCNNYQNPPNNCQPGCYYGCVCDNGYVRNQQGECVPTQQCNNGCPANQHYEQCATLCPLTCNNYQNPPTNCGQGCYTGCVCNNGYVRNQQGNCVTTQQCNNACPANQHYESCGTACPLTCDNYKNPPLCTAQCVSGCQCNNGLVLNRQGQCIAPGNCPNTCPANQHYESCGTACPLTCDNYQNPPACTANCKAGCQCNDGYVQINEGGQCIPKGNCPIKCPANQHYESCGTACPLTCDNYQNPPACTANCKAGCQCNNGYVLNRQGQCIPKGSCPITCPVNTHYESCPNPCPLTCDNYRNPPTCTSTECNPNCVCNNGYVLNRNGQCVPTNQCPGGGPRRSSTQNNRCPQNEEYNNCGSYCPPTCQSRKVDDPACQAGCRKGCECKAGYTRLRKDFNSPCVRQCPEN